MTAGAAIVWVEGPDSTSFLHGLLSSDIAGIAPGDCAPSLLLDATGHVRVMLRAVRTDANAFTLVTDAASADRLATLLDEYHFSEDVEIIGPEPVDLVTFALGVVPMGADLVIPGDVPETVDAVGRSDAIVAATADAPLDPTDLEARRIAAGVPRFGVDISDRTLVHEAGLQMTAVSFDKGCYLGQETVARVEHRGAVNRRLVGLRLSGAAPAGAAVHVSERPVGTLTSAAFHASLGHIGLAVLRNEAQNNAHVAVDLLTGGATVVELPFPDTWDGA